MAIIGNISYFQTNPDPKLSSVTSGLATSGLPDSSQPLNSFGPQMHQLTSIGSSKKIGILNLPNVQKIVFFSLFFRPFLLGNNPPSEFSSSLGAPRATAGRAARVASRGGGAKVGRH